LVDAYGNPQSITVQTLVAVQVRGAVVDGVYKIGTILKW
jgi:hypothetical protein